MGDLTYKVPKVVVENWLVGDTQHLGGFRRNKSHTLHLTLQKIKKKVTKMFNSKKNIVVCVQ